MVHEKFLGFLCGGVVVSSWSWFTVGMTNKEVPNSNTPLADAARARLQQSIFIRTLVHVAAANPFPTGSDEASKYSEIVIGAAGAPGLYRGRHYAELIGEFEDAAKAQVATEWAFGV